MSTNTKPPPKNKTATSTKTDTHRKEIYIRLISIPDNLYNAIAANAEKEDRSHGVEVLNFLKKHYIKTTNKK